MTRHTEGPPHGGNSWEEATGFKINENQKYIKFTTRTAFFCICFCLTNVEGHVHHRNAKNDTSKCIAEEVSQYKLNDSCTRISTYYASQEVQAEAQDYM